jgi:hypothetical protein
METRRCSQMGVYIIATNLEISETKLIINPTMTDQHTPPTLHFVSVILFILFLFFAAYLYYDYKVLQLQENVLLLQSEIHTNIPE